jgi:hypothetical protein
MFISFIHLLVWISRDRFCYVFQPIVANIKIEAY